MSDRPPLVTLTTDFGETDAYVAAMKGVLYSRCPILRIADLSHAIPPQDIRAGAFFLAGCAPYFPPGTIHVAVVDPGVGAMRHPIAAEAGGQYFVGPDNGLFALACGMKIESMGRRLSAITGLDLPEPKAADGALRGAVVHIDRFGNCITNLTAELLGGRAVRSLRAGKLALSTVSRTYSDADRGAPLALIGSAGYLEFAVREGDAARTLNLRIGDPVDVTLA